MTIERVSGSARGAIGLFLLTITWLGLQGCVSKQANFEQSQASERGQTSREPQSPVLPCAQALQVPIGTVHMVDEVGKFILIKSSRTTELEPGVQIIAYGPDARMSSHLKASPARKGAYLAADLIDGVPNIGDMVMMVKTMTQAPGESQPASGRPAQILE